MGGRGGWGGRRFQVPRLTFKGSVTSQDTINDTSRSRRRHSNNGSNGRLTASNWCAPLAPKAQSWFHRVMKAPPRKADLFYLCTRYIVDGYLLSTVTSWVNKMKLNFCACMAGFCKASHVC